MKTFVRLIRRYVLTAVGIVLLLLFLGIGMIVWISWREGSRLPQRKYAASKIADSMAETENGLRFGSDHTPQEWMNGYSWAMIIDDYGYVKWNYHLPEKLNHHYTSSDIASFTRWYLDDYPVFCWTESYGLFVIGLPKGSLWKYSIYNSPEVLRDIVRSVPFTGLVLLLLGLALCLWLGWRGTKRLKIVATGLDCLAEGQTVQLPTNGFTGELAEKLNQTSAQLQKRNEMLTRRDDTRTQWIAGVSHDVRTPLSLILGWGEQLEHDAALPDAARQKAANIRTQCEKLRSLIDDLNLTSKLEYGAQPLRKEFFAAGPLFRELVAQFYDNPVAENCEISLVQSDAAEHTQLLADRALLSRLLENLLNNSIQHNSDFIEISGLVEISIHTEITEDFFRLTVADNGKGYPPEVLAALHSDEPSDNAPHILGLHVVEQIASTHGGKTLFCQNVPAGAKAVVWLPVK